MLLADIGNSYFHIYDGKDVVHLSHEEAIKRYAKERLYYICVKPGLAEKMKDMTLWENIAPRLVLHGAYDTMGIDRKALCLSHPNGIFVDAGSAITVDMVEEGHYKGGFILPGIKSYLDAYRSISPVLDTQINKRVNLEQWPLTTKDGISYGIIASIKALIDQHRQNKRLYVTGGDGFWLSSFFEEAVFDETLVFKGMRRALGAE
ncbi:MAG: type III pantothenate kinase [Campylobacterales bacterium]|nr:type III pantothenate kinase [Campylobacterales bacterium]